MGGSRVEQFTRVQEFNKRVARLVGRWLFVSGLVLGVLLGGSYWLSTVFGGVFGASFLVFFVVFGLWVAVAGFLSTTFAIHVAYTTHLLRKARKNVGDDHHVEETSSRNSNTSNHHY